MLYHDCSYESMQFYLERVVGNIEMKFVLNEILSSNLHNPFPILCNFRNDELNSIYFALIAALNPGIPPA